jgi:hypothetical protein
MASVKTFDSALDLEPNRDTARRFLKRVADYWTALQESSAAAHEYEQLTRHGTPHAEAIERVFDKHFR